MKRKTFEFTYSLLAFVSNSFIYRTVSTIICATPTVEDKSIRPCTVRALTWNLKSENRTMHSFKFPTSRRSEFKINEITDYRFNLYF